MKTPDQTGAGKTVVARKTDGNPEGKGVNGFLLDWSQSQPKGVVAKPRRQLLAEFFTSMLVLSARFKFRPVPGVDNYLYWMDGDWSLSLIAPGEWSHDKYSAFAGTCVLQHDMTWTITLSESLNQNKTVSDALATFYDGFAEMLDTDLSLEEILPFYVGRLPYFQRLYASALSRSMRAAVSLGNQTSTSCRQWNALLPQLESSLLTYKG